VTHPLKVELFGFSAEQLVAQELISYSEPSQKGELYYWHNESPTSNAEVDFIIIHNKTIIPVEVKSKIKGE
jgi:predicted AAA+ superfamily ATPase